MLSKDKYVYIAMLYCTNLKHFKLSVKNENKEMMITAENATFDNNKIKFC